MRIGGPIPESLMSNLYFAPPDPQIYTKTKIDPTTIERPTRRRKTLAKGNVDEAFMVKRQFFTLEPSIVR